jgi:hypothetical protein
MIERRPINDGTRELQHSDTLVELGLLCVEKDGDGHMAGVRFSEYFDEANHLIKIATLEMWIEILTDIKAGIEYQKVVEEDV